MRRGVALDIFSDTQRCTPSLLLYSRWRCWTRSFWHLVGAVVTLQPPPLHQAPPEEPLQGHPSEVEHLQRVTIFFIPDSIVAKKDIFA
jgi:hypothetical protein